MQEKSNRHNKGKKEIRASIDIGSNSCLLLAGCFDQNDCFEELINDAHITSLGKGLDQNKVFSNESMEATTSALLDYKDQVEKAGLRPEDTIVTATEAARVAQNAQEYFAKIRKKTGFKVHIISAEDEAYYTFVGAALSLKKMQVTDDVVLMDIGGASTELIKGNVGRMEMLETISLPMGGVRGTHWMQEGEFEENINALFRRFGNDLEQFKTSTLVCTSGTMTALGGMILGLRNYDDAKVNGRKFPYQQFVDFLSSVNKRTPEQLSVDYPFLGKRVHTIHAGINIGLKVADLFEVKEIFITTYGLRYGTLYQGKIFRT